MNASTEKEMVSVIIPAFNEPALPTVVAGVMAELERLGRRYEIIVIDDGSEPPAVLLPDPKVRLHRHHRNRGYGASLKQGIMMATGAIVLMMDADDQHRAEDIGGFLSEMDIGADAVLGSRQKIFHSSLWRMPGKMLIRMIAGYLVAQKIPDPNCGFRAVRTRLMRRCMRICPNGFSFSTTTTLVLLSEKRDVVFHPIDVDSRKGKSTVRPKDGARALLGLLRTIMLFSPLRVLLPPSLLFLLVGTVFLIKGIFETPHIHPVTILLLSVGTMFFFFGLLADQIAALRKERL